MKEEHFEVGTEFDFPTDLKIYFEEVKSFFETIGDIVINQNHKHKQQGINHLERLINDSAYVCDVNVSFNWSDGQWHLVAAKTPQDVLNLYKVTKAFKILYRHNIMINRNNGVIILDDP